MIPSEQFKNVALSKTFKRILRTFSLRNKAVLDLGCGSGQHLIHFGEGSIGVTSAKNEVGYGKEHGLQMIFGNVEQIDKLPLQNQFDYIWANNLFEHLLSPHAFLMKLKNISNENTQIILGVPMIPRHASLLKVSKFRGALASNHINFFTKKSLKLTVERAGWFVKEIRPFIFKNTFLDFLVSPWSPHLYCVASNNVNFKYSDKKVHEWKDEPYYDVFLKITGQL